jgi:sodium transport system ATP-binding protein
MNRKAIQNVSFVAKPGCITGLLGANGSGKTTLMRLISGVLTLDSGNISICGADVHQNSSTAKQHLGVLLGGDISLYNRLTAYENIMYFAKLQGVDTDIAKHRLYELAHILEMDDFLTRRVAGFSRGMRQKIAFCRTVIHNPDVILLDEPSTGLDIYSIRDVEKFILYYKSLGKTILLSTHNAHEIETLCDHLIILKDGQVILDSSYKAALCNTNSDNAMDLFFHFEGRND